tara:strand:+ start:57304 stop:58857 length:1554 start_codon:yes stop_codon:yes gene_type:complete
MMDELVEQLSQPLTASLVAVWFVLGSVLAWFYGFRGHFQRVYRVLVTLAWFLIGPLIFPFWMIQGVIRRVRRDGVSMGQAFRSQFANEAPVRDEPTENVEPDPADSFVILDSQGKVLPKMVDSNPDKANGFILIRKILRSAVMRTASDILVHPTGESQFDLRYRINGTLCSVRKLSEDEGKSVVNIIKAIAGMNIAERRRPQDGGFSAQNETGDVSFRVATTGVLNGEKVSIRILDQSASEFSLSDTGLLGNEEQVVRKALMATSGMILVCGPTGSGKSSTVHAMLRSINCIERNVITIEDPIEYVLPNASQIEINNKAGITFASVLRSVLRQDPDVISVGEIRDPETAEIALQAAQTGHLVFATVHAGSNMAALLRLTDLGIQPQLIASAVNLVVSQRLVRRLCDHCKVRAEYTEAEKNELRQQSVDPDCLFKAKRCKHCHRTGYSSRTGVFDITVMDREIKSLLVNGGLAVSETGHAVGDTGSPRMTTMQVRATQLALMGMIPWEEVQRLTATID